jgi:hypothetical protein
MKGGNGLGNCASRDEYAYYPGMRCGGYSITNNNGKLSGRQNPSSIIKEQFGLISLRSNTQESPPTKELASD